ncbi:TnsA endonuclease N-terminal domain-containing protein [Paenibacillus nasutitermitis]|uniref:TnsA endonuclease N-terminal domain-containing protein n=1 Tax=Paenibacillus nasutitermitis TaxID=1652958 RepID=A0A917DSL9_9BACL|nr:TnsA endonuclease N-terminal domain-containing protein [Paenibacillus nasutitermitis]GGD62802.1 hypothetical protein GCM10010911_20680 [Paenibacillus nasutitermitis]
MNYKPIIVPRNKKYGNNYWETRGPKVEKRDVILYSDLEFDHWLTVECDHNVNTYCEQPKEITFVINGTLRKSIFDMVICDFNSLPTFVEVKYECELKPSHKKYERTMRQIEAQVNWCNHNGFSHEVRTEKTIRKGRHTIENKLRIISNIQNIQRPTHCTVVSKLLESHRKIKVSDLYMLLHGQLEKYDILVTLHWLYYEGKIAADLDETIWGDKMEVSLR